jgi:hypothetical protein
VILADTSIWIAHFRGAEFRLAQFLDAFVVVMHPHVLGELALGSFRNHEKILIDLKALPTAIVAEHDEVLELIGARNLHGRGIGYTDAHLVASALLQPPMKLWTGDRRLADVAMTLGLAADFIN